MQFTVRTFEVFCSGCANDLAKLMEQQGIGEVVIEPIATFRDWVKCGKCARVLRKEVSMKVTVGELKKWLENVPDHFGVSINAQDINEAWPDKTEEEFRIETVEVPA